MGLHYELIKLKRLERNTHLILVYSETGNVRLSTNTQSSHWAFRMVAVSPKSIIWLDMPGDSKGSHWLQRLQVKQLRSQR